MRPLIFSLQFHQKRDIASWCKFIFKNTSSWNSSNSTLFVDIAIPSRYNFSVTKCHTVATRWLCEDLAKSCIHRKTIGKHRVSIVLPSCGVQFRYRRWPHEVKTMATRTHRMSTRWPHGGQEGHTKSTRSCTFGKTFGNFLTCQRFCEHSRSCCRTPKTSAGGHTMA